MNLTVKYNQLYVEEGTRLQLWVSESSIENPAVFVFQRISEVPHKEPEDVFVDVASIACMNDYPSDDPGDSNFFRKQYVDLIIENALEVQPALDNIIEALKGLEKYDA
jgi:hypothetical protein